MLQGCRVEFIEHYLCCLMEAKVKLYMMTAEFETGVTRLKYLKYCYFDRKVELYTKLITVCTGPDTEVNRSAWVVLHQALVENDRTNQRYFQSWGWN